MSPPELLDHILSYLQDDLTSLLACTLTSSTLCSIAHYYIYKSIKLGQKGTGKQPRQRELLLRTLKSSAYDYGSLIKDLILDKDPVDLLELAPHLTNLKSLTLKSSLCKCHGHTLPSYPNPLVVAIRDLVSQPRFISLDIEDYEIDGGIADLEFILEGANNLKHLGLTCVADTRSTSTKKPVAHPIRTRAGKLISLESLTLGFRQLRLSEASGGPVSHPILLWLGQTDCVIDIGKVKQLKMINAGWYKVGDVTKKLMGTLESLEMEEKDTEDIVPDIVIALNGISDIMDQRNKCNQWFTSGYFPKLRDTSLLTLPVDRHCDRGATPLGIPWKYSMLEPIGNVAPQLRTLSLQFHGQFQLPLSPRCEDPSFSFDHDQCKTCEHTPNYVYDNDDLPLKKTLAQWMMLCGRNIKKCVNLEQLNVSFVEGKMLGDLDQLALQRRRMYAELSKYCIQCSSDFPEERIKVILRDYSGVYMQR